MPTCSSHKKQSYVIYEFTVKENKNKRTIKLHTESNRKICHLKKLFIYIALRNEYKISGTNYTTSKKFEHTQILL